MRYGHSRKRPHDCRKAFSGRGDIDLNQILGNWALTEMTYRSLESAIAVKSIVREKGRHRMGCFQRRPS